MNTETMEFAFQKTKELLAIDSPTGYTAEAEAYVLKTFAEMGFRTIHTRKGGVIADLGGPDTEDGALLFEAHTDTLGGMVAEVKSNGRLRITPLGGLNPNNTETENAYETQPFF